MLEFNNEISDTNFEVKATDLFKRISVYAIKAKHYKYLSETSHRTWPSQLKSLLKKYHAFAEKLNVNR